jgi:hypothetical protein
MILHRAISVIPNHINGMRFHPTGGEIPPVRGSDIGLLQFLTIDEEFSVPEFDLFILKGNDSLQERYFLPCKTDYDDIAPVRP